MARDRVHIDLTSTNKASKNIKQVERDVSSLGNKGKKSLRQITTASKDSLDTLDSLGNRFRYLSMVTGILAAGSVMLGKSLVNAAREGEAAMMKLGVMATTSGESMEGANAAAKELAATGLMSLQEASTGLANLLASDLNLPQATKLIKRMLDTAVLAKESITDTYGQAIIKSTLGLRIFQERQVDAIGINFRMDNVMRKYGKTLNKTVAQMTNAEKHQAIYNFLMEESERYVGGAELATTTFGGALSKLSATINILKIQLGQALIPMVGELAERLQNASTWLTEFSKEHLGLISAIIMGTIAVSTLIAAFATIGALVPMISTGIGLTTKGLATLAATTIMMAAKFIALGLIIGGLIYLFLKITGVWDKWTRKIQEVQQRIAEIFKPMEKVGEAAEKASERAVKAFDRIKKSVFLTVRSFKEGMREWAEKHDTTIKKLRKDINALTSDYSIATKRIRDDFKQTMSDLDISHARTTEDLKREIDEEVSKGIWANQTRIRDLKRRLKRENEDYARSTQKNKNTRDEDLTDEEKRLNERLSKLQSELDKELQLENKHANLIAEARTWPILDEIEKRTRAYKERLEQYATELKAIEATKTGEITAIDAVSNAIDNLGNVTADTSDKIGDITSDMKTDFNELNSVIGSLQMTMNSWADTLYEVWSKKVRPIVLDTSDKAYSLWSKIQPKVSTAILDLSDWLYKNEKEKAEKRLEQGSQIKETIEKITPSAVKKSWFDFASDFGRRVLNFPLSSKGPFSTYQEGGIIPGASGSTVPILAHAGETVIPAGISPITVNINNPTVREEQDIRNIANAVRDVLSRQQFLRHWK